MTIYEYAESKGININSLIYSENKNEKAITFKEFLDDYYNQEENINDNSDIGDNEHLYPEDDIIEDSTWTFTKDDENI